MRISEVYTYKYTKKRHKQYGEEGCIKSKLVLQQQNDWLTIWPFLRARCHVDTLACKTIAQNVIVVRRTVTF